LHSLFLYSDHRSFDFHITAADEMLGLTGEVRIFPFLDVMPIRLPAWIRSAGISENADYRQKQSWSMTNSRAAETGCSAFDRQQRNNSPDPDQG
jgi:hypothetical protein